MLLDLFEFKYETDQESLSSHKEARGMLEGRWAETNLCRDSSNHSVLLMLGHPPACHNAIIKEEYV